MNCFKIEFLQPQLKRFIMAQELQQAPIAFCSFASQIQSDDAALLQVMLEHIFAGIVSIHSILCGFSFLFFSWISLR